MLEYDTLSDIEKHKKRQVLARRQTEKRRRNTTKAHKPTGKESHSAATNTDGRTRDETQLETELEEDKRRANSPPVIDLTHSDVNRQI